MSSKIIGNYLANSSHLALAIGSAALVGVALSVPAAATDWTGAASTDWFTAGNWNTGVVPTSSNDALINTTAPNPTAVNGANAVAKGVSVGVTGTGMLTISNGGTLNSNLALWAPWSDRPARQRSPARARPGPPKAWLSVTMVRAR
ncbi:MAG: hypothetical protein WAV72_02460 [Bradyrhizobium sp.]